MRGLKDLANEGLKDLTNERARRAATKVFSRGTKHLLELRSSRHLLVIRPRYSRSEDKEDFVS